MEAEDCQIRAGYLLVFHQLPTSPLGQLLEFFDRDEQVVEPASSHVAPASTETNLSRMPATVSIPFVVSEVEGILSGERVDTSPDDLSTRDSHLRKGPEEAEAMLQALQQPVVVPAQQEGVKGSGSVAANSKTVPVNVSRTPRRRHTSTAPGETSNATTSRPDSCRGRACRPAPAPTSKTRCPARYATGASATDQSDS